MEPTQKEIYQTIFGVTKLERKCNEIFDRQKQYKSLDEERLNEIKAKLKKNKYFQEDSYLQFIQKPKSNQEFSCKFKIYGENKNRKTYFFKKETIPFNTELIFEKNQGMKPNLQFNTQKQGQQEWYYFNNENFRSYQYELTRVAITQNTLLSLPTGMGKTFVALNVIYNYYKWFPEGKIFFLAPTKPLVQQQYEKILQIKNFNEQDIISITGDCGLKERIEFYKEKKIFFMTPQTLEYDLKIERFSYQDIVLIVFDEAHKAIGNYSYKKIAKTLEEKQIGYRILAMTASPGSKIEQVQQVIDNLKISRFENREENEKEIWKYSQQKHIYPIILQEQNSQFSLSKLLSFFKWDVLCVIKNLLFGEEERKLIPDSKNKISYQKIQKLKQQFIRNKTYYEQILKKDELCSVYYSFQILQKLIPIKKVLYDEGNDFFFKKINLVFKQLNIKNEKYLNEVQSLTSFLMMRQNERVYIKQSQHQNLKIKILQTIIREFISSYPFIKFKIIVFTWKRQNASYLQEALNKIVEIHSSIFIGQNKYNKTENGYLKDEEIQGFSQEEQIRILQAFQNGKINLLIATSIAEEGLDIDEVDLIVCYDSVTNPLRIIQRIGRTGRTKSGKIVFLLYAHEYGNFKAKQKDYKQLSSQFKTHPFKFYKYNSRMVPDDIHSFTLNKIEDFKFKNTEKIEVKDQFAINLKNKLQKMQNFEENIKKKTEIKKVTALNPKNKISDFFKKV